MSRQTTRRDFLKTTTAAGTAAAVSGVWSELPAAESTSPNEKLNIASIGTANRAYADISGVASQNIVALCDVDEKLMGGAVKRFPNAKRYRDFRIMLDKEKNNFDAVVVGTTDHTHAMAAVGAMRLGKHCYCEKPLTHTVHEARLMAETAAANKVATQMGNQIHAGENYRRVVEIIQSGALGKVSEVHVMLTSKYGGKERPKDTPPVPNHLNWDLWLGPAPKRPYHATYHPHNWRHWWDFGTGALGDFGCHYMDLPFWALKLRHPTSIAAEGPSVHPESCPTGLKVQYQFPARDDLPPVKLTWYDGDKYPKSGVAGHIPRGSSVLFIGDQGQMTANYSSYKLYPEEKFADYKRPEQTIPRSIGHHNEWIKACKRGTPTTCNFDYGGALTETVLLGNVAFRTGETLQWDAKALKATNCPDAERFVRKQYRKGWVL